ncbi:MAG: lipoyl(octanoyl) transferase LipB [Flavobacteriales bacterium]
MKTKARKIHVQQLGQMSYAECWALQEDTFAKTIAQKSALRNGTSTTPTENILYFVEHPPVITLGKSGDLAHLLITEAKLQQRGVDFHKTNRGGDITFHGPGQLVGYPILDLDHFFTDIHRYLRLLEEVIIATLAEYHIQGYRSDGETGVWLDPDTPKARKICAMGVRASRWVTMHGFALNVNTDLSYFNLIVPCGIQGKQVTSLARELGCEIPLEEVQEKLEAHFANQFEAELLPSSL